MSGAPSTVNVDPGEIARFDRLAQRWWDPEGPSKPLHDLNPVRLAFVAERTRLKGAAVLDVGCGGGLLSEALASEGATVTAIDLSSELIETAKLHLLESGREVDYRQVSVEALAEELPGSFDAITCMELLEHVPDPAALLAACHRLLKPGGQLFVSTLNRTPKAFALAIVGAEYVMRLLPRGTHRYAQFIRPSELARWLRSVGFQLGDVTGLHYDPFGRRAWSGPGLDVNYLMSATRAD